jgi:hypothetical protein
MFLGVDAFLCAWLVCFSFSPDMVVYFVFFWGVPGFYFDMFSVCEF